MRSSVLRPFESGFVTSAPEVRLALEAARVPVFRQCAPQVDQELRRCRRYRHPLSALVLGMKPESLQEAIEQLRGGSRRTNPWFRRHFECTAQLMLGWIVRDGTRETDLVCYAADHDLYAVFMPEAGAEAALASAERLGVIFQRRSSVMLKAGLAAFPTDALTLEDLFQRACLAWREAESAALKRPEVHAQPLEELRSSAVPRPEMHAQPLDELRRVASHG